MFTPQKVWSGLSLTPKSGAQKTATGTGPNPNSGEGTASARGKGVAFFGAKTPGSGSGSVLDNGLNGSGEGVMDREVLVERISNLEKELYEYQFNMGLLLIEKKEWNSKYNELSQDLAETKDAIEREKSAHLIALSEAEKREENLRKALGVEKECVLDLERALREMRSEHAAIKFTADSKLAEANALVASIEEKSLEVEAKIHAADAKLAEISRKTSEIDRKSLDLEAQESALQRDRLSFIAEREGYESTFSKQREDLWEWEKKLQEGEERLAKGQKILNEREQRANESDRILREKEKDLEEAQKKIDATYITLREKEDDIDSRLGNITLKEKEYDDMKVTLDKKEEELSVWEEKINAREKVEVQKLLEEHNAALDVKRKKFEVELEERRISFEDEMKNRLVEVEKKEAEVNHMDEKITKREQALEKKLEKLREKEKDYELKLKALKEREKTIKSEEKNLEKEKGLVESEREQLLSLKDEAEKKKADNEKELSRMEGEIDRLKVTEEERLEYVRLQSELRHEIDQYMLKKKELLKEADDLRQQKETFEREWDELDLKKVDVEKELKNVSDQKDGLLKLQQLEEEELKNEKQTTQDYIQRELEDLKLAKESFAAEMEQEKLDLAGKIQSERNQLLRDLELQRRDLETDMENQLEQKEKDLLERKKLFEEERVRELDNINYLREVASREMEEMKLQRSKLEREKQEADENKGHLESQRLEMRNDIDELVSLNQKLRNQREQFIKEREHFIEFVEKLRSCLNCGELISEFMLSGLKSLAEMENVEVPSLPKLVDGIVQGGSDGNIASSSQNPGVSPANDLKTPVSGGTISWLRKCTSKIFKISPGTKIGSEDIHSLRDVTAVHGEKANKEGSAGKILDPENEAELSYAIVSDSLDVRRVESDSNVREVEAVQDLSVDIVSKAPEAPEDSQTSDLKGVQQKPRNRGRPRVKRTHTVKDVIKDAQAILGGNLDKGETDYPNGNAEDSANTNSESQDPSSKRLPANARKRNHVQTSDGIEEHVDSKILGKSKRRRQAVARPTQTAGEARYNLRRPKVGTKATSTGAMSGVSKESQGEIHSVKVTEDRTINSEASPSHSVGVSNENGGSTHHVQVTMSKEIAEAQDGYGNATLSEEVNGTPDRIEEHEIEYGSESRGEDAGDDNEDDDEDGEHPGEVSIGKKLWNFFTT